MTEATKSAVPRSRVLVVDDDAALAEMLSIVLRNEGFEPDLVRTRRQSLRGVPAKPSPTWCCWI